MSTCKKSGDGASYAVNHPSKTTALADAVTVSCCGSSAPKSGVFDTSWQAKSADLRTALERRIEWTSGQVLEALFTSIDSLNEPRLQRVTQFHGRLLWLQSMLEEVDHESWENVSVLAFVTFALMDAILPDSALQSQTSPTPVGARQDSYESSTTESMGGTFQ